MYSVGQVFDFENNQWFQQGSQNIKRFLKNQFHIYSIAKFGEIFLSNLIRFGYRKEDQFGYITKLEKKNRKKHSLCRSSFLILSEGVMSRLVCRRAE